MKKIVIRNVKDDRKTVVEIKKEGNEYLLNVKINFQIFYRLRYSEGIIFLRNNSPISVDCMNCSNPEGSYGTNRLVKLYLDSTTGNRIMKIRVYTIDYLIKVISAISDIFSPYGLEINIDSSAEDFREHIENNKYVYVPATHMEGLYKKTIQRDELEEINSEVECHWYSKKYYFNNIEYEYEEAYDGDVYELDDLLYSEDIDMYIPDNGDIIYIYNEDRDVIDYVDTNLDDLEIYSDYAFAEDLEQYMWCEQLTYDEYDECWYYDYHIRYIHSYHSDERNFKPLQYSANKYGFGLEIEVEVDEFNQDVLKSINDIDPEHRDFILEEDGSLDEGFEMVTRPFRYDGIKSIQFIEEALSKINKIKSDEEEQETCGGHIHINRDDFWNNYSIASLMAIIYSNWNFVKKWSERVSIAQLNEYSYKVDYRTILNILNDIHTKNCNKYSAVNIKHSQTIELRFFQSTTDINKINKRLQQISNLITFCNRVSNWYDTYELSLDIFSQVQLEEILEANEDELENLINSFFEKVVELNNLLKEGR